MKTFRIFNNTASFDEDLVNYKNIIDKGVDYRTEFLIRHLGLELNELKSYSDFNLFKDNIYQYFVEEVSKIAKSILQIYVDYKIYDMTTEIIIQRNSDKISAEQKNLDYVEAAANEINELAIQVKSNAQNSIANNVNEQIQGHYFDVYSTHYSDIVMNEWFNNREKERIEKQREQAYTQAVNESFKQVDETLLERAQIYQEKFYEVIRNSIEKLILPMYEDCIKDLVSREKISKGILENLQEDKALAINENINMITNEDELERQIIVALQLDPYIEEIHAKIIKYISDYDIQEYIELIKSLKLEDEILKVYLLDKCNHIENQKCLKILKRLTDTMKIDKIVSGLLCRNEYTKDSFKDDLSYTNLCFKSLKDIWGTDNSDINKFEQEIFVSFIKRISNGSNLIYDGSINRLDYDKLYEFFLKRQKEYNDTLMKQKAAKAVGVWIGKHIKGIIVFIIILVICYFASKNSRNAKVDNSSTNVMQNTQEVESEQNYIAHYEQNYTDSIVPKYSSEYDYEKSEPFKGKK